MVSAVAFSRLLARPVDRVHIAASTKPAREVVEGLPGLSVSPLDAAFFAPFLAVGGMTWDEVQVPLRYVPGARVREQVRERAQRGVVEITDDQICYTEAGRRAAEAVLDARAAVLSDAWKQAGAVRDATRLVRAAAQASVTAGRPSSAIVDKALSAARPTAGLELWRLLAKVRRFRADCHAQAWSEAGCTVTSIVALGAHDSARVPIEARTDELNAQIWEHLDHGDQLALMAALASLDGSGTPR